MAVSWIMDFKLKSQEAGEKKKKHDVVDSSVSSTAVHLCPPE